MAPQYKITYFEARGYAEQSRFVLAYAGIPFEDVRYTHESWDKVKPANSTWGLLPMLEEDGKPLAQSNAMVRYLGKKFNLAGDSDYEAAKCDEVIEALGDLKKAAFPPLMEKDEAKKIELVAKLKTETFPKFLSIFSKLIEANGGFLVGKRFSIADFAVAATLDIFADHLGRDLFDNHPAVKSHFESVFNAKGIKEWVAKRPKTQY